MKTIIQHRPLAALFYLLLSVCFCTGVQGQKKKAKRNERHLMNEFRQISNLYKQLPLFSEIEIQQSSNLITRGEDTASVQLTSYVDKNSCYLKVGEVEHIINDSLSLMVHTGIQRMSLYHTSQSIQNRIAVMTGFAFSDSSIESMLRKYEVKAAEPTGGTATIVLESRSRLHTTEQPKETIELVYDAKTRLPVEVITVKRTLRSISEEAYSELAKAPDYAIALVTVEAKRFLIKEQKTSLRFQKISHQQRVIAGPTINDRIQKNTQGEYVPVKSYEGYTVTIN